MNDLLDDYLTNPEDDLLGVAESARIMATRLAEVRPPFTTGIYGEWGSGKTTFVYFVAAYLRQILPQPADGSNPVLFIDFSAWQYRTADEVWRALMLRVAQKLLGVSDPSEWPQPEPPVKPSGLGERLKCFLAREALVIRDDELSPARSAYLEVAEKLDAALYGGISKGPDSPARINSTEAGISAARSAFAAMAGMSPVMSAVRGLLGLNNETGSSRVFDRGKNQETRQRIESMEQFKKVINDLFAKYAAGRRVVIFVDDLDRCMPDVALDTLEAIKTFLRETPCIFVVAADETLIGQGLRIRLRNLHDASQPSISAEEFLSQKGREYFEKIIQLPVHLPRPAGEEVQRFIGVQFPAWKAASDLIEVAIGGNPRRLKQYCNRLQYQRMVCQLQEKRRDAAR